MDLSSIPTAPAKCDTRQGGEAGEDDTIPKLKDISIDEIAALFRAGFCKEAAGNAINELLDCLAKKGPCACYCELHKVENVLARTDNVATSSASTPCLRGANMGKDDGACQEKRSNDAWKADDRDPPRQSASDVTRAGGTTGKSCAQTNVPARCSPKGVTEASQPEIMIGLPETSTKRARDDILVTPHCLEKDLFSSCNQAEGVELYWDLEDHGLARRKAQALLSHYDLGRLETMSDQVLIEASFSQNVQCLHTISMLEQRIKKYKESSDHFEKELKKVCEENAKLQAAFQKAEEERKAEVADWKEKYETECCTGTIFLSSEAGRLHVVNLERLAATSAVRDFKESAAFYKAVAAQALEIYDDVVKHCQDTLRKSGRVGDDIVRILDPPGGWPDSNTPTGL